jgi:hypothetical protein
MCAQRSLGERTKIAGKTTKLQLEQSKLARRHQPWAEELTAARQGWKTESKKWGRADRFANPRARQWNLTTRTLAAIINARKIRSCRWTKSRPRKFTWRRNRREQELKSCAHGLSAPKPKNADGKRGTRSNPVRARIRKTEHQKENTTSGKHVETKEKSVRDGGQKTNATQSQIWPVNSDRVVTTQNGEENIAHPRFKHEFFYCNLKHDYNRSRKVTTIPHLFD